MAIRQLEERIRTVWTVFSVLIAFFLGLLATAVSQVFLNSALPGSTVFLFLALAGVVYSRKRYFNWGFELREDHLYLEHGVFRKVYSMVPYVRVQHVDTQRSVIDRVAGLSSVVVYTAGSRGADVTIPGLDPEDAENIQEKLRDVAIQSEDRDAV